MSLVSMIAQVWNREVNSGNILVKRWPWTVGASNLVTGVSITSGAFPAYSAWTTIIAAAKIDNPSWITGIFWENPAVPVSSEVWGVDLATGAAGLEVSLSSGTNFAQGLGTFSTVVVTAVGVYSVPAFLPLPPPGIRVTGAPRVSAAVAGLLVGGKTSLIGFQAASGVGT